MQITEKALVSRNLFFLTVLFLGFSQVAQAAEYKAPRNEFGHPDLQGVWTNATMTPFERPKSLGNQRAFTPEVAKKLEENNPFEKARERDALPTDPNAPAPKAGSLGAYNVFWMDPGTKIINVNGEYRTSIVMSPENGQVPYTDSGKLALQQGIMSRRSDAGFDGPEVRALGERCLVGFGSTGGPPMLPVLYNNHYQIIQNKDYVAILVEMNHDVRFISLAEKQQPNDLKPWLGQSSGYWDGETLVVETKNIHPSQEVRIGSRGGVYVPQTAKITERFTRAGDDKIIYQFTVEDEKAYTSSWTGEMAFHATDEKIFEYACHEGNYALPGILAGARRLQSEGKDAGRE